jgi:hypothetical protein
LGSAEAAAKAAIRAAAVAEAILVGEAVARSQSLPTTATCVSSDRSSKRVGAVTAVPAPMGHWGKSEAPVDRAVPVARAVKRMGSPANPAETADMAVQVDLAGEGPPSASHGQGSRRRLQTSCSCWGRPGSVA